MTREALDLCCGFFQSTYGHVDGSRTTERSVPSRNANLENVSVTPFDFKSKAYLHMVGCMPSVRVHSISVAQMSGTGDGTKSVRVMCTGSMDVHFKRFTKPRRTLGGANQLGAGVACAEGKRLFSAHYFVNHRRVYDSGADIMDPRNQ